MSPVVVLSGLVAVRHYQKRGPPTDALSWGGVHPLPSIHVYRVSVTMNTRLPHDRGNDPLNGRGLPCSGRPNEDRDDA
jgi:hypothetical protein